MIPVNGFHIFLISGRLWPNRHNDGPSRSTKCSVTYCSSKRDEASSVLHQEHQSQSQKRIPIFRNVSITRILDDTDSWHKMASRSHIHKDMIKPDQKVHCRLRWNILSWWQWVWLNIWWRHRDRSSHMMSQENCQYRQESVTRSQAKRCSKKR